MTIKEIHTLETHGAGYAEGLATLIREDGTDLDAEISLVWEGDWCYAGILNLMND